MVILLGMQFSPAVDYKRSMTSYASVNSSSFPVYGEILIDSIFIFASIFITAHILVKFCIVMQLSYSVVLFISGLLSIYHLP